MQPVATELWPRLDPPAADELIRKLAGCNISGLEGQADITHPRAGLAATGGVRVAADRLRALRSDVRRIATANGYPDSGQAARRGFDTDCAEYLAGDARLPPGEALRNEVWSFIALVLLPDVAVWRFPNIQRARLAGGTRNVFQRLWRRGWYLSDPDTGPDRQLLGRISEDAFSAVFERPGLSASPVLARAICNGWIRCADRVGESAMEAIHRIAIRNLRADLSVLSLDSLERDQLNALIDRQFAMAVREANGHPGQSPGTEPGET